VLKKACQKACPKKAAKKMAKQAASKAAKRFIPEPVLLLSLNRSKPYLVLDLLCTANRQN